MAMNRCLIKVALALGACGLLAPLMPSVTALAQSRRQQPHPGHEHGSGHGHGPATTGTYGTYFFALQEVPQGAVSTITKAQDAFKQKFGNQVQINDPQHGLHVSVVRLGTITDKQAAKAFDSAQVFVTRFVKAHGNVNFNFHNKTGTAHPPVIKNDFVSYNVYLTKDSKQLFYDFATGLATAVGAKPGPTTGPETGQTHISILHYNPSIDIGTFIRDTALPSLTLLDYKPTKLVLLETYGVHQYREATVGSHLAEINLQPK